MSYCRQRGSDLCGTARALRLCLHTLKQLVRAATKVAIYLVHAAHSAPSDGCWLGPYASQDVRVRPFHSCEAAGQRLPTGRPKDR